MTPSDYEYLQKLLKDRSGLILSADKRYLVESRLIPLARRAGVAGITELVQKMKSGAEPLIVSVVEAMTTNETFFFRDKVPFDHFSQTIMPALLEARKTRRTIRIWCAACSTGQEPYSLAMILKEMGGTLARLADRDHRHRSVAGSAGEIQGRHLQPVRGAARPADPDAGEILHPGRTRLWQISAEIRSMVQFRQLNLLQDFSHLGVFDVIFCRNVLIYFDLEAKIDVLNRLARMIEPDGFLTLGAAETVVGVTNSFAPYPDRRGLYRPGQVPTMRSPSIAPTGGGTLRVAQAAR